MRDDKRYELGQMLRAERKRIGYTQKELAEFVGCSRWLISRYENGHTTPDYLLLEKILDKLIVKKNLF